MNTHRVRYPDDCIIIRDVAHQLGFDCTLHDAEDFWEEWSDRQSASWLTVAPYGVEMALLEALVPDWDGNCVLDHTSET